MITWRVVMSAKGEAILVFVPADDEEAARLAARKKIKREHRLAFEFFNILRVERMMI